MSSFADRQPVLPEPPRVCSFCLLVQSTIKDCGPLSDRVIALYVKPHLRDVHGWTEGEISP